MTIQEIIFWMQIVSGILGIVVFAIIVWNFNNILAFFWPESWAVVLMFEADNHLSSWLQHKDKSLTFKFKEGDYNLYEAEITDNDVLIKRTSVYRAGRLSAFVYKEGGKDPIDIRAMKALGNPQLSQKMKRVQIADLWTGEDKLRDTLFWLFGVAVVAGIVIIIYLLTHPATKAAAGA